MTVGTPQHQTRSNVLTRHREPQNFGAEHRYHQPGALAPRYRPRIVTLKTHRIRKGDTLDRLEALSLWSCIFSTGSVRANDIEGKMIVGCKKQTQVAARSSMSYAARCAMRARVLSRFGIDYPSS